VCLHGVQSHGRRFRRLAEERLVPVGLRVVAPDLRGHGASPWEPPWHREQHVDDVVKTAAAAGVGSTTWIGHSFGARLALDVSDDAPELVERLVLLDPALTLDPPLALELAEAERPERSFATRDEALARRAVEEPRASPDVLAEELEQHLVECDDGLFRYRYCQSAVVAMYGDLAAKAGTVRNTVPTLLVRGAVSEFVPDAHVEALGQTFGELLEVVTVSGGHIVLWDAFDETAVAVERFLRRHG
jgi:lipase